MKAPNDYPHGGDSWQTQQVVIAGPCSFRGVAVANKSGSDFWVWVCDAAGQADKPSLMPLKVTAGNCSSLDWSNSPRTMLNGIYVCATSDPFTKTLITTADAWFDVAYEIIKIENPES